MNGRPQAPPGDWLKRLDPDTIAQALRAKSGLPRPRGAVVADCAIVPTLVSLTVDPQLVIGFNADRIALYVSQASGFITAILPSPKVTPSFGLVVSSNAPTLSFHYSNSAALCCQEWWGSGVGNVLCVVEVIYRPRR